MGREDRKRLFEVFDKQDFEAIYAANDFAQARSLLEQDASIAAVVLEFEGDADDALKFCSLLQEEFNSRDIPVVGLHGKTNSAQWSWLNPPKNVRDWIRSPIDAEEAVYRVEKLLQLRSNSVPSHFDASHSASQTITQLSAEKRDRSDSGKVDEAYRFAFDASQDEIVISDPETGVVLDVNATFERRAAAKREQLVGQQFRHLALGADHSHWSELETRLKREGNVTFRCERRLGDGSRYWADVMSHLMVRNDRIVQVSIFRRPEMAKPLRDTLQMLTSIAELGVGSEVFQRGAQKLMEAYQLDMVIIAGASPDSSGNMQLLHFATRLPMGGVMPVLENPSLVQRVLEIGGVDLPSSVSKAFPEEQWLASAGIESVLGVALRGERKESLGVLIAGAKDPVSRRIGVREAIQVLASRFGLQIELDRLRDFGRAQGLQDSLTGLPNRMLFNDRLETTIKEAQRTGELFALLFVDLDRFKTINDSLGHALGDEVLIAVAKRLRSCVRGSDTVARYAGDEFTLILRHIVQKDDVTRIAEKVRRALETPVQISEGRELHITSSIGISFYPDDTDSPEKLLQYADIAMYSAKGMGRNNFQAYIAVPEESHQQRLALEAKLRMAEKNGELRVFYQPQVDAESEDLIGMEALIRWEHPELGMISPGFFIPLAEETGLIVSIGEWVLRQACVDTKRWHDEFNVPLRISVNLSALQLRQNNLVEIVKRALDDTGLDAQYLDLEVTESINVKTIPNLIETLTVLRSMGCKISIDDFGTGQSSLDYIRRFPADRIKIDQVFVRNIGVDPDDEAIVRATINMAQNLGRGVVAEGVEFEEHLSFLREHGCEELQGYLFCRPIPPTAFRNMMQERAKAFGHSVLPL